ncbi:MAG TPA: YcnI family protein [Actinoplanes sp.]
MIRSPLRRAAVVAATAGALLLAVAAPAAAHVTVNPNSATQGGFTKVSFRVPNEMDSANTTKLEVNLPTDTPVAFVSLKPVTGWTATTEKTTLKTPIKAEGGEITEAISKITWTAQGDAAIKPGQFQEFDVSLGPLPEADQMIFKALQTYSDGTVVRWIDEPAAGTEPEHPAPVLKLTPAAATGTAPAGAPAAAPAAAEGDGNGTLWGVAGIALGLIALLLGLLAYRRAGHAPAAAGQHEAERESVPAGKAG